jgi:hypothetical protein
MSEHRKRKAFSKLMRFINKLIQKLDCLVKQAKVNNLKIEKMQIEVSSLQTLKVYLI